MFTVLDVFPFFFFVSLRIMVLMFSPSVQFFYDTFCVRHLDAEIRIFMMLY